MEKRVSKNKKISDFRKTGYRIVDWIDDYFTSVEKYPVRSTVKPGEIASKIPTEAPLKGEAYESLFGDFERNIIPGITHWQHPAFFAYFPANSSPPSVLAELLSAGLGVQGMLWETSPAATELEERMMQWLRDIIGLPDEFRGVIQDTASTATLSALVCARERTTKFLVNKMGLNEKGSLRVYISDQAHSSVEKGAKIAGFGRENVVCIGTNERFEMIPEKLKEAVLSDLREGFIPACVTATVGTTSSTAIDPVEAIGDICKEYGLWLHVDAAYAGNAAILPEKRHILNGIENADSFVFNPHKWLFTNFDCSAFYVKDPLHLKRTFSIDPEYLKTARDDEVTNFRDWHIQLGRRFRALKLWFVIRHYGVEGLRNKIRNHIAWAADFASWVDQSPDFERLAPSPLALVCFRYNPAKGASADEERLARLNQQLLTELNESGEIYLTHTRLKGKYCMRMSIGQTNTSREHVRNAWELIREKANGLI